MIGIVLNAVLGLWSEKASSHIETKNLLALRSSHLCHPGGRSINESSLWKLEASVWNSFIAIPEQLRKMLKGKIRDT